VSWVLAVDFGTSNTAAAFADDGGAPLVLEFDVEEKRHLPSVVVADAGGNLLTGKAATRQASAYPERTERVPKRALAAGDKVVLGGRGFEAAELAGAVLRKVFDEAVRIHGGAAPDAVILTHPARWGEPPLGRLREAAALAGIAAPVRLLSEPEAAAWFYAPPVPGHTVAVFDLGGGTLDTAVLRASADGFALAGQPGGDAELGGEDFDEALLGWVTDRAAERDQAAWAEFAGDGPRARRDRALLRADVTTAKETLSDHLTYDVPVPGFPEGIRVTRADLDSVISAAVDQAVAEARRTIDAAGADPGALTAVYLTGGSSRVPLIAQRLAAALDVLPRLEGDLKAVVVLGALRAYAAGSVRADGHRRGEPRPAATAQPAAPSAAGPVAFSHVRTLDGTAGAYNRTTVNPFAHVAWSPDGSHLAVIADQQLQIWSMGTGRRIKVFAWRIWSPLTAVGWAPDGSKIATGQLNSGKVKIWTLDGALRQVDVQGIASVASVAWNRAGDLIAVGDVGGDICVIDSGSGGMRAFHRGSADRSAPGEHQSHAKWWVPPLAWRPQPGSGRDLLAFGSMDSRVRGLVPGEGVSELLRLGSPPLALSWSPDGNQLAVSEGPSVTMWRQQTGGKRDLALSSHASAWFRMVQWTGDGRSLAAFGRDLTGYNPIRAMTLWDAATGAEISSWNLNDAGEAKFEPCRGIALSPAGARVARVWQQRPPEIWEVSGI
jgi:actin-like ATPase involved in cell morphogenesis